MLVYHCHNPNASANKKSSKKTYKSVGTRKKCTYSSQSAVGVRSQKKKSNKGSRKGKQKTIVPKNTQGRRRKQKNITRKNAQFLERLGLKVQQKR